MGLPLPELPAGAVLLFEHMAVDDQDRSGNRRFYLDAGGGFFEAHNTQLHVDELQLASANPRFHWNVDLPSEPLRRFDEEAMERLRQAIASVDFDEVDWPGEGELVAEAERWTAPSEAGPLTVVVINGRAPAPLDDLRALIESLCAPPAVL